MLLRGERLLHYNKFVAELLGRTLILLTENGDFSLILRRFSFLDIFCTGVNGFFGYGAC